MKTEKFEELKMDYIDGTISDENLRLLKDQLLKSNQDISELDEMKSMMLDLDKNLDNIPFSELKLSQTIILEPKPQHKITTNKYLMVAVYTIGMLGVGAIIGSMLTSNKEAFNQETTNFIQVVNNNTSSVGNRIEALNTVITTDEIQPKIIELLLNTFNNDENINVRLSALNSLSKLSSNDKVRSGLIASILNQESAIIQISLLKVMLDWNEKKSIKFFAELIERENTDQLVINEIENALEKI